MKGNKTSGQPQTPPPARPPTIQCTRPNPPNEPGLRVLVEPWAAEQANGLVGRSPLRQLWRRSHIEPGCLHLGTNTSARAEGQQPPRWASESL